MSKTEWVDWYIPADFYQQSWSIARKYVKAHPDADRDVIYTAATEAADLYELSERLRAHFKFRVWCRLRIRTALYIAERKEKMPRKKLTDEQKAEIVQLHQEGLTRGEIASKVGVGTSSVDRVLKAEKEKTAESASAQKEKPEAAKITESGTSEKSNTPSIPPKTENVKLPELDTVTVMKQLAAALRSEEVTEFCMTFTYGGERYRVDLRKVET